MTVHELSLAGSLQHSDLSDEQDVNVRMRMQQEPHSRRSGGTGGAPWRAPPTNRLLQYFSPADLEGCRICFVVLVARCASHNTREWFRVTGPSLRLAACRGTGGERLAPEAVIMSLH